MIPKLILSGVVILSAAVFVVDFAAKFFIVDYQSDPAITGVFGIIAGAAFAAEQFRSRASAKTDDKPPES